MIAKPFIDRFRPSSGKFLAKKSESNDNFLRLFQLTNKITSNNKTTITRLAEAIFSTFKPSYILISTNHSGALKVTQAWQGSTLRAIKPNDDTENKITGRPSSSLCELVKNNKQTQSTIDITQDHSKDLLLNTLEAKSYIGFPVFNEKNNITAVIALINSHEKRYSEFEISLLESITSRIGREINSRTPSLSIHTDSIETEETRPGTPPETQLKAELDTANKTLESISYTISHDLRAPLRSIESFSKLLTEEFSTNLPEEANNYLSRVRRATKRMSGMIDDLLWLSKVTRRKLVKQEVNLSKSAENIISEIKDKHAEYKCVFHTDPHLIAIGDKNLLKIALQHILGNACKFSRNKDEAIISLTHFVKDGKTVYKISDNGCGFDMNHYDQLFEPFKKLHDDSDYEGTGIGLATIKRIIQRHGGTVWMESEVDEGTSVFFTLGAE